ncbi:MAG: outer membrane protein assembly factor BamA, partial [Planctomycetota bacterium]
MIAPDHPTTHRARHTRSLTRALLVLCALVPLLAASPVRAADAEDAAVPEEIQGRLVESIRFEGLERVPDLLVRNQMRTAAGRPLDPDVIQEDLRRFERLGEFRRINADVVPGGSPGSVIVVFEFDEAPIVEDVLVVGNRQLTDNEVADVVRGIVSLLAGVPIDEFQIGQGRRAIEDLYRERGFYQVEVTVDRSELEEFGNVIFQIREGERVRITSIRFEGNEAFTAKRLRPNINTKTAGIFQKGPVDEGVLDRDVAAIVGFYRDNGYLDARAGRRVTISPNGREAIVTFLVEEGELYTLREVQVFNAASPDNPLEVMDVEQVRAIFSVKPGDVFADARVGAATEAVRDAYRTLGYVDAVVTRAQLRDPEQPVVDVRLGVREGDRFKTGLIVVQGNELTQQRVIRRRVDLQPDRWLDATQIDRTERRLRRSQLFNANPVAGRTPTVTVQPEDPALPGFRDVLVEIEETNTGSLSFGAAVSSDAGLTGVISLEQRNFDVLDLPDSFDELLRGRAFRGAGQQFNLTAAPGTESSSYSLSITEPALFDSPYSLGGVVAYRDREFNEFDEERITARLTSARNFGTRWQGGVFLRAESIDISDVDFDAPVDIFEVEDQNTITSVGFSFNRQTYDNPFRPTRGTRTQVGLEQVGVFGGDFDYTKLTLEHKSYFTVSEDFLGRRSTVFIESRIGYVPQGQDDIPIFERFFLGGRSFRGFDFRGIGPVGVRNDNGELGQDSVGGAFSFFLGAQYERPIWRDIIAIVGFVDSG